MSVLDVFTIVFDSDTKKAESGYEKVTDLAKNFVAMVGAYFAFDAFKERAEEVELLARASDTLGDSVEDLSAFSNAAIKLGGDLQGTMDSITDMSEAIGEVVSDPKSSKAESFKAIGLAAKNMDGSVKTGLQGLLDLAEAAEKLDRQQAIFRIKEIGITDNRTIDLILKGKKGIQDYMAAQKKLGVATQEDVDVLRKFKSAMGDSGLSVGFWMTKITTLVLPAVTAMVEAFNKATVYLSDHKVAVVGFIAAVAAIIAAVYIPTMAVAAAETLIAFGPLILIGAAIAAVAAAIGLLAEDVYAFLHGQNSLIGEVMTQYPAVGDLLRGLIATLVLVMDVSKAVWGFLADLFTQPSKAIENFSAAVAAAGADFGAVFGTMNSITDAWNGAMQAMGNGVQEVWDGIMQTITGAIDVIMERIRALISAATDVGSVVSGWFGGEDEATATMQTVNAAPLAAMPSTAIGQPGNVQKNQTVTVGEITVNTASTDPQAVNGAISQGLADHLQNAAAQFDDGVRI